MVQISRPCKSVCIAQAPRYYLATEFFSSWLNWWAIRFPLNLQSRRFCHGLQCFLILLQREYKSLFVLMAWMDANVISASSPDDFGILLKLSQPFTETFYLPSQNHYMKLTLKMTDDLPWSLNWVSPGAGLWLPVCTCFLDLNYIAIFASSRLVLFFSCTKYVWVGNVVWSSEKHQEQACSMF